MNKILVANLKMNLSRDEIINYKNILSNCKNLIVCPSNIHLELLKGSFSLGAQDGYYIDKGPYTGEVSFYQLKDMVSYCIIGHSERRRLFGESDELIIKKLNSCINNGITPILCVGESIEEKNSGITFDVLKRQLSNLNISSSILIAYEPVYAIGTGVVPSNEDIEKAHLFIKEEIKKLYNVDVKVLYGGSVNLENAKSICSINNVDGLLIGGSSNDPNNMLNIINKINL